MYNHRADTEQDAASIRAGAKRRFGDSTMVGKRARFARIRYHFIKCQSIWVHCAIEL
jgi:hypothetical protein